MWRSRSEQCGIQRNEGLFVPDLGTVQLGRVHLFLGVDQSSILFTRSTFVNLISASMKNPLALVAITLLQGLMMSLHGGEAAKPVTKPNFLCSSTGLIPVVWPIGISTSTAPTHSNPFQP